MGCGFILRGIMANVIVDERLDPECERALRDFGYRVLKLPKSKYLQQPVAAHPDMLVFIFENKLFCHERYYSEAKTAVDAVVEAGGFELTLSAEEWESEYPHDVLFNAASVGNKLICSKKSVSKLIADLYDEENVINTKQGYAKCSTCTVGERGIITADPSVARSADGAGIDVLLLNGNHTRLEGYDTGFIGGASGDDGENVYFCGDISKHPEGERIADFCLAHGRRAVSLSDNELYDYGSLIFVR